MAAGSSRYTILYDGGCRICSAFAHACRALSVRRNVEVRPIQASQRLLANLPPADLLKGVHVLDPAGQVSTAGQAMPAILAALVDRPAVEVLLRSSDWTVAGLDWLYETFAAVRGQLTCGAASPSSARALPP